VLKLNLVTAQTTVESKQAMASKGKTKVHAHHLIVLWFIMLPVAQPQLRLTLSASWWMQIMQSLLSLEYHGAQRVRVHHALLQFEASF